MQRRAARDQREEVELPAVRGVGRQRALHAHLGGPERPGLVGERRDVLGVADDRGVEVAVGDERQLVADHLAPHLVGELRQGLELLAVGGEQVDVALVGQAGGIVLRAGERGAGGSGHRAAVIGRGLGWRSRASPRWSARAITGSTRSGCSQAFGSRT